MFYDYDNEDVVVILCLLFDIIRINTEFKSSVLNSSPQLL